MLTSGKVALFATTIPANAQPMVSTYQMLPRLTVATNDAITPATTSMMIAQLWEPTTASVQPAASGATAVLARVGQSRMG